MEKIYMEESQRQKKSKSVFNFSVLMSFVVAIFAIFSLAMFGITSNQATSISYAAAVTGDSFYFYHEGTARVQGTDGEGNSFFVPLYYSDDSATNPVFCIEHKAQVVSDESDPPQYLKGDAIEDYGLLYILDNSLANDVDIINGNKYVETWATQVAVWLYLYEKNPGVAIHNIDSDEMAGIQNANTFNYNEGIVSRTVTVDGVYAKIRALVDEAKNVSSSRKLSVTKASDSIAKSADGNYYQSAKISVVGNPSTSLTSYTISVSGIDGAYVVDADGRDIEGEVAAGTDFYVRVPAEKVTEKVQTLNVNVTGKFTSLTGNEYYTERKSAAGEDLQKVVSVTGNVINVNAGTEVEFIGAPDTGMNAAQTIYFIGLIVLLCGVGIVYANAKPVESK